MSSAIVTIKATCYRICKSVPQITHPDRPGALVEEARFHVGDSTLTLTFDDPEDQDLFAVGQDYVLELHKGS